MSRPEGRKLQRARHRLHAQIRRFVAGGPITDSMSAAVALTLWGVRSQGQGIENWRSFSRCFPSSSRGWSPASADGPFSRDSGGLRCRACRSTSVNRPWRSLWPSFLYRLVRGVEPERPAVRFCLGGRSGRSTSWSRGVPDFHLVPGQPELPAGLPKSDYVAGWWFDVPRGAPIPGLSNLTQPSSQLLDHGCCTCDVRALGSWHSAGHSGATFSADTCLPWATTSMRSNSRVSRCAY